MPTDRRRLPPPTPTEVAGRTCLRPTGRGASGYGVPTCVGSCQVLVNLGRWHSRSLGAAVFDTSITKPYRAADGSLQWRTTTRWTVVDTHRAADGSVQWVSGDYYPPEED